MYIYVSEVRQAFPSKIIDLTPLSILRYSTIASQSDSPRNWLILDDVHFGINVMTEKSLL